MNNSILYIRFVLLLILFTFVNVSLFSHSRYSFRNYNINNGLSQNTVLCILQDNLGFMWFGTKDGLNRFDGTSFKIFRFSPDEDLQGNVFHHILQDKNENIWVATENGIYIYSPRNEKFTRFYLTTDTGENFDGLISDLIQDNAGDIWISVEGKGVLHYNFQNESLAFHPVATLPSGLRMISLGVGINNDVWVFPYGLPPLRIDKMTGQMSEFQLNDNPNFLYELGEVHRIAFDDYNQLLIATSRQGLISINTINRTHRILLDRDAAGNSIFARTWKRIDNQTIWVGTESGIHILNTRNGDVVNLRHNAFITTSLSDNAIYSIYKDRDGGIWVGSYFGGVDYFSMQFNKFELFYPIPYLNSIRGLRVREFHSAPDGNIWIGTEDNGLNLFDPNTAAFLPISATLSSLHTNIHALLADGDYLWVGTFSKGLNRYNLRTGSLTTYVPAEDPNSIRHYSIFALHKDRQNTMWVGTLSGLSIYNREEGSFTHIEHLKGVAIQDVFEDRDGKIWISTFSNGLYRFNPLTNEWRAFTHTRSNPGSLAYNRVTSVFEDSKRRIWVTTQGGGFSLFDRETETFTTFNSLNGLINNVVYRIVEDNNQQFWLSTNAGLVRFDPKTESFRNFTVNNGLRTNQFNYKSSYKTADGTIYFGSINGFIRFNPADFTDSVTHTPPIVFTDFFINNRRVSPTDKNSPLKQSILHTETIVLPHNKNSFSIRYTLLDYNHRGSEQVFYKLEGFDSEWFKGEKQQVIVYANLSPGKYTLRVRLNSAEDAENERSLAIRIRPPFWFGSLMLVLYALLIIFGGFMLHRFLSLRNLRLQQNKMRDFEQQKEREQYQSKIDFFTNVAHEIRTPLSLIKAPLDHILMTENVTENVKDNLQIMSKNTEKLLTLISQLLDFRKTESDAYLLNLKAQNVSELLRETLLRFTPTIKQRKLNFEFDIPKNDMFVQLDRDAFTKIINNLISNAVKYCATFVRIKAYIAENNDGLHFHLITENDGEVIPVRYRDEIFKPFVRVDKEKDVKVIGTGVGLALALSLTKLHKGTLFFDDSRNLNRFHLTLPVGRVENESTKPEEIAEKQTVQKTTLTTTILLVDDDRELLDFEKKCLSPHYNILTAENGKQALAVLQKNIVHLIVSDVMMPEMDGLELTQHVKSNIEFSHIPVILLTAKTNEQSKVQGYETGADAYIDKPFSVKVLMAQIENLLQNREKLREAFFKQPFVGASSTAFTKADEEFIKKLHAAVLKSLNNSEFVVEDLAEQFHMSRASFYRKIKGTLDLSPNEYIRVERLKEAARMLKDGTHKVSEVYHLVGFNSPSYFTKCFRKQFGVLPKDF